MRACVCGGCVCARLCNHALSLIAENLELADEPKLITHPEVGRFFREFRRTHYVANGQKNAQYPQDENVTRAFVTEKYK